MTNIDLQRIKVIGIIIVIILIGSIGSFLIYSNSAAYSQISSFVRQFLVFKKVAANVDFNNPRHFTFDVSKVKMDKNGATLINNAPAADIILLTPLKLTPDTKLLSFKEDAIKDRNSKITYQLTSDYKSWYYFDGKKWTKAGSCTTCTNNAIEIEQNIDKLPIISDGLQVKAFLSSTKGNLILKSVSIVSSSTELLTEKDLNSQNQIRLAFAKKAGAIVVNSCDSYCQNMGSSSGGCEGSCDNDESHESGGDQYCSGNNDCCCKEVKICHRTGSDSNPYSVLDVAVNAIDGQGTNDHTNHVVDSTHNFGDIIPITDLNNDGSINTTDCLYGCVDICHDPNQNPTDLCVPPSQVQAHLDIGDTQGTCPQLPETCAELCAAYGLGDSNCEGSCDDDETRVCLPLNDPSECTDSRQDFCSNDDCCCKIPPVPPTPNPTLPESCGLDIVLVLDSSDSIDDTELAQVKNAGNAFVNALAGTPTNFAVVDFDTQIINALPLTDNTSAVHSAINSIGHTGATELTNWEASLIHGQSLFAGSNPNKPNLMVIITDGDPTTYGYPTSQGDYSGTEPDPEDISNAIAAANAAKSAGTRMLAIGVTSSPTVANLIAISGSNVNTGTINTDVITTDFAQLFADLAEYAIQLCGGTITVNKYINEVSPETRAGAGWGYNVTGTPKTTDTNGQTEAVEVTAGSGYSVIETTVLPGYSFLSAACYKQDQTPVGSATTNGIQNITINNDDIIYCNFVNQTNCGNGIINTGEQCDDNNNNNEDGCNSQCQLEYCGDYVLQPGLGEQCDDGNTQNGDGCDNQCHFEPVCGNNLLEQGEQCDDGNAQNGDGCSSQCVLEYCGDNVLQPGLGEQCDDGNNNSEDGCSAQCFNEYCGDNILQPGLSEECDDGNAQDGDGCDSQCQNEPVCGNNVLEQGEECDGDNNPIPLQWCSESCAIIPGCGNSILEEGEECDDGNNQDGDGCSGQCINDADPVCGNNIWQEGEECDGTGGPVDPQWCTDQCTIIIACGNNYLDAEEECDDGNNENGDGCDASCQIENPYFELSICYQGNTTSLPAYAKFGYSAVEMPTNATIETNTVSNDGALPQGLSLGQNSPLTWSTNNYTLNENPYLWTLKIDSTEKTAEIDSYGGHEQSYYNTMLCPAECGNSIIETEEQCDDGNANDNDGCSSSCQWEWDLSEIIVQGDCVEGSAAFTITNNGQPIIGDMTEARDYRIYRNNALEFTGTFLLAGDGSLVVDGSVYAGLNNIGTDIIRLEADQHPAYPGELPSPALDLVICSMAGLNAIDDTASTTINNQPLVIDILANDYYDDQAPPVLPSQVTITIINPPANGSVTIDPETGLASYSTQVCGQDIFTYKICDIEQALMCDIAVVTVDVGGCGGGGGGAVCGNQIVEEGETCDDGNILSGDGCSNTCQIEVTPVCGNEIVEAPEQCDDGNQTPGDGCSATCTYEGGGGTPPTLPPPPPPPPPTAQCGNGLLEGAEQCDDGNTADGDGCSSLCIAEIPLLVIPPPAPVCGNGLLEAGEACDDGNAVSGDGCSAACIIEPPPVAGAVAITAVLCRDYTFAELQALGYFDRATNTVNLPITGVATLPTGAGLASLEYSINGGAFSPISPAAPAFSQVFEGLNLSSYSAVVRATFTNGTAAISAPCDFSFLIGCLEIGGNEFVINAQQSSVSPYGVIQFNTNQPQTLYVETQCNDYALVRNLTTNEIFNMSFDVDRHLWTTNNIIFTQAGNYNLEVEIGNRFGETKTRQINTVTVVPQPTINVIP